MGNGNVTLELNPYQVAQLVEKLSIEEKIRLVRRLERETWAGRLNSAVKKVRHSIKKAKITNKDIERICQEVKREYNERRRRH